MDKNESSQRQNPKEGQDMISNLPDFIIGVILSLLSTKEAVRTSVLSKRWTYLWTFITELTFDDRKSYSTNKIRKRNTCFVNFVFRVLLHLKSSSIQSFFLVISEKYDSSHVNEWISAVLNRRVKKLCVNSQQKLYLSSHTLSKCQSVEKLVLEMDAKCVIKVPNFVCLSSLTVLELTGIKFTRYSSDDSKKLTLNFPLLKEYSSKDCTWSGVKSVTFEVPLLQSVIIEQKIAPADESHAEIIFCASRVGTFTYFDYNYTLSETTTILLAEHVAIANIALFNYWDNSVQGKKIPLCKLLINNNVKLLKLNMMNPREVLARGNGSFNGIPTFRMLNSLVLDFVTGEILLGLLLKSPFLKTLQFLKLLDFDEELLNSAMVPNCFQSTLQEVDFSIFDGEEHEYRFAEFLIGNAQALERFRCNYFRGCSHRGYVESVKAKLLSFKKSSSFAIIDFPVF